MCYCGTYYNDFVTVIIVTILLIINADFICFTIVVVAVVVTVVVVIVGVIVTVVDTLFVAIIVVINCIIIAFVYGVVIWFSHMISYIKLLLLIIIEIISLKKIIKRGW